MIHTEMSADTRLLADMLIACSIDEVVTYGAMTEALGRDILVYRYIVISAAKVAMREAGAVFVNERGVGYRRISAERATETVGPHARGRIRRTARRARGAIIAATNGVNDLSPEAQRRASTEISNLGLLEYLSRDSMNKPKEDGPTKPQPVGIAAREMLEKMGIRIRKEPPIVEENS